MTSMKQLLAMILSVVLFFLPVTGTGAFQQAFAAEEQQTGTATAAAGALGDSAPGERTWAEGAKLLCRMLGYLPEDAADIDLRAYADSIPNLSIQDDSLYLAILAEQGYLEGMEGIQPDQPMPPETFETLLASAFPNAVTSQEQADAMLVTDTWTNLALGGEQLALSSVRADRVALGRAGSITLSGIQAHALVVLDTPQVFLKGAELDRVLIDRAGAEDTLLRLNEQSQLPEVVVARAGAVTIEGNGSLGLIRVTGDTARLTVRATSVVVNETETDLPVTGPDGESQVLAPGKSAHFVLNHYLVHFVTAGTPVPTQLVKPGEVLEEQALTTAREGYVFTAWYEDAAYTRPFAALSPVEGEMTLYARFVDEEEALTVTFETFGGTEVAPLVFAKGENLLVKPVSQLRTSKEGFVFSGWCLDEALEHPFGYSEPILESMTLYAQLVSLEPHQEERESTTGALEDIDWQAEIPLSVPAGVSLAELPELLTVEPGSGGTEPVLSFRETGEGGVVLYGAYFERDGQTGFEPGSTFTIRASGGVGFLDFPDATEGLYVSVFREQVEIVEFAEDLEYLLWDEVVAFQPTREYQGAKEEGDALPGEALLQGEKDYAPGDILVFYDGEINDDEKTMTKWREEDGFDGYVFFAELVTVEAQAEGTLLTFCDAQPVDYVTALDVHTRRDAELEGILDAGQISLLERDIVAQVTTNEELRAQMMMAAISDPSSQELLDDAYGEGRYQLAKISASISKLTPAVKIQVSGNSVTAGISISASITLKDGENEQLLKTTVTLSFTEKVEVGTTIDGGWLWLNAEVDLVSTTTVSLTITAFTGEGEGMGTLLKAKDALAELVKPQGLVGSNQKELTASVHGLMEAVKTMVSAEISYIDIFSLNLFTWQVNFKGIVFLEVKLDLVGQIGMLAAFGVEVVITQGEKIGFRYNFLKFSGESYKQKTQDDVTFNVYLIGKLGVRLGLRLTVEVSLFKMAKAGIVGELFAYAELSGLIFYSLSLKDKSSTNVGGLVFEVGLDANISLKLTFTVFIFTKSKSWTLWSERWPLWNWNISTQIMMLDDEKLDALWEEAITNADTKRSFGIPNIPVVTYNMADGKRQDGELLWDEVTQPGSQLSVTLEIEKLVLDGEEIPPGDPRFGVFVPGDGTAERPFGRVYLDEALAGEIRCREAEADVRLTFRNNAAGVPVKVQSHTFHVKRDCTFVTTTVNLKFVLNDWCARQWGLERAAWDGTVLHEEQLSSSYTVGSAYQTVITRDYDLAGILEIAAASLPELAEQPTWVPRTRNLIGQGKTLYSVPKTNENCFIRPDGGESPGMGSLSYQAYPNTETYTLEFDVYAYRFPGDVGDIDYIVTLLGDSDPAEATFFLQGTAFTPPKAFSTEGQPPRTWKLATTRNSFTGLVDRALLMGLSGATPIATGLTMSGREPASPVLLEVNPEGGKLTVDPGLGIAGVTLVSPDTPTDAPVDAVPPEPSADAVPPEPSADATALVPPLELRLPAGTAVTLEVEPMPGFRVVPTASLKGVAFQQEGNLVTFQMPFTDVTVSLEGVTAYLARFQYNLEGQDLYELAQVDEGQTLTAPEPPTAEGLTFRGWYTEADGSGTPYVFDQVLTEDVTLYAGWTCDVTVDFGGGEGEASYIKDDGTTALFVEGDTALYQRYTYSTQRPGEPLLQLTEPSRTGYLFTGWYLGPDVSGVPIERETFLLDGAVTLYAGWTQMFSVRYDLNYDPSASPEDDAPVEIDATFAEDYTPSTDAETGEAGTLDVVVEEDPTGTAPSLEMATDPRLHFLTVALADRKMEEVPRDPARQGYTFTGWYTQADCPPESRFMPWSWVPTKDLILYAGWDSDAYPITYDLQGGRFPLDAPVSYTMEDSLVLPAPERPGYAFTGWEGTGLEGPAMVVEIPLGSSGARAYTATWEIIEYEIAYALNGGTQASNPAHYTIESEAITLLQPVRSKHIFLGWLDASGDGRTLEQSPTIPAGSTGNRAFTAMWEAENLELKIVEAALAAIADGHYNYLAGSYTGGVSEDSSVYAKAYETMAGDSLAGLYLHLLTLTLTEEEVSDEGDQIAYLFTAQVTFTEGDESYSGETGIQAIVQKSLPELSVTVEGMLAYGEPLSACTFSAQSAAYEGTEVPGTFQWKYPDLVPLAADNGRELYTMQFVPDDAETYQSTAINLAVSTQRGVVLSFQVQDRRYNGSTEALPSGGTYTLRDADTSEVLTDLALKEPVTYAFANAGPGDGIEVVCSADALDLPADQAAQYALVNLPATTTASIWPADLFLTNPSQVTMSYGDMLADALLRYGTASDGETVVEGTWSWGEAVRNSIPPVGRHMMEAVFTPTPGSPYLPASTQVSVTVLKKVLPFPPAIPESDPLPGEEMPDLAALLRTLIETPGLSVEYGFLEDAAYDYYVKVALSDPARYAWKNTDLTEITEQFKVPRGEPVESTLTIETGEGIEDYTVLTPGIASGSMVPAGTRVTLEAALATGARAVMPAFDPVQLKYQKVGNQVSFLMPAHDLTIGLTGVSGFQVQFLYNYGEMGVYQEAKVEVGQSLAEPVAPVLAGLTFQGWYREPTGGGEPYDFGQTVEENLTLYAIWTCEITVDFGGGNGRAAFHDAGGLGYFFEDESNGFERFTFTQQAGKALPDFVEPFRGSPNSTFTFIGWYLAPDGAGYPIELNSYLPEGDMTLYAGWQEYVSLHYNLNYYDEVKNGSTHHDAVIEAGQPIPGDEIPADPTRPGYLFTGWYTDSDAKPNSAYDVAVEQPTENMWLFAGWALETYPITYALEGGAFAVEPPSTYTVEDTIVVPEPARPAYTFTGWQVPGVEGLVSQMVLPRGSSGPQTCTAVWSPINYRIDFRNMWGGDIIPAPPRSYTVESETITLGTTTRDNYVFAGWRSSDDPEGLPVMFPVIPAGSTGDKLFTAVWTTGVSGQGIVDAGLAAIAAHDFTYTIDEDTRSQSVAEFAYPTATAMVYNHPVTGPYMGTALDVAYTQNGEEVSGTEERSAQFTAVITFRDDDGATYTGSVDFQAVVKKPKPYLVLAVQGMLQHGQTLDDCVFTEQSAYYRSPGNRSTPVEGEFRWADGTIVPQAADNGKQIYTVLFTPTDTETFQPSEAQIAVDTQTRVQVKFVVDSRAYDGSTKATARFFLLREGDGLPLQNLKLKEDGLSINFDNPGPGRNINATCTGIALDLPEEEQGKYVLVDTTVSSNNASITRAYLTLRAPSLVLTYGQALTDDLFQSDAVVSPGSVYLGDVPVPGTWGFGESLNMVPKVGSSNVNVRFYPVAGEDAYATLEALCPVRVWRKSVPVPDKNDFARKYEGAGTEKLDLQALVAKYQDIPGLVVRPEFLNNERTRYAVTCKLEDVQSYVWETNSNDDYYWEYDYRAEMEMTGGPVKGQIAYGKTVDDALVSSIIGSNQFRIGGNVIAMEGDWSLAGIENTAGNPWPKTPSQPLPSRMLVPGAPPRESWDPEEDTAKYYLLPSYVVTAVFTPENPFLMPHTLTFPLHVEPVTPNVEGFSAKGRLHAGNDNVTLREAVLTVTGPTGQQYPTYPRELTTDPLIPIQGRWEWQYPDAKPQLVEEKYPVIFVPHEVSIKTVALPESAPVVRDTDASGRMVLFQTSGDLAFDPMLRYSSDFAAPSFTFYEYVQYPSGMYRFEVDRVTIIVRTPRRATDPENGYGEIYNTLPFGAGNQAPTGGKATFRVEYSKLQRPDNVMYRQPNRFSFMDSTAKDPTDSRITVRVTLSKELLAPSDPLFNIRVLVTFRKILVPDLDGTEPTLKAQ